MVRKGFAKRELASENKGFTHFKPLRVKITTQTIRKLKEERPIVALTAYDAIGARLAAEAGVDLVLVGDSLGNTALGFANTIPVTLEMMIHHTAAVARANPKSLIVADVPFACAHGSFDRVLENCAALIRAGAQAVKIEGGSEMADTVKKLSDAGIAVLGHIGLLPQQYHKLGGYRKFGASPDEFDSLLEDAHDLESAGAFAIVGEMMDHEAAKAVSKKAHVPLIGIGSGPHCDGQVLVFTDVLGLGTKPPPFAKQYADLGAQARAAIAAYADEVKTRKFPQAQN